MKKNKYCILITTMMCASLVGCGKSNEQVLETPQQIVVIDKITDDKALASIQNYCYNENPDLKDMVKNEKYNVYWELTSSNEKEIVVLYRSYTSSLKYFYIDRETGDTRVTELVPGVLDEETPTDELFNIKDYIN